jgi:CheY-specific phosphatase CheX
MSPDERTPVISQVTADMVAQIVESVFVTMMNLEVYPSEIPWAPSHDQLTSVVHLSGDWNGALVFECNRWQACRFAGHFLSTDPPDAVNEDVRDVLGELANMIGGNMKCAVASGLNLSMPSVTDGSDYGQWFCGSKVQDRLGFECAEGPFWVSLLTVTPEDFTVSRPGN